LGSRKTGEANSQTGLTRKESEINAASKYNRLSKDDAVALFVDHQSGLIFLVQDYPPGEVKNNVLALASTAKFFKLPTVLTTSFDQGPNGPLVPKLKEMFPEAPLIPRPGQINAWDNDDFVTAVQATGRRQLIIADAVTAWSAPLVLHFADGYDKSYLFTTTAQITRQGRNALIAAD
jgi:hypothetical protein